jgi:type IV pilus assembly protein PilQ
VADSAADAGTYVGALDKFCRTLLAPRIAGVSCMASAHLKERIQHLMSYPSLQKNALSHRASTATAFVAVLAFIATAGAVTAKPRVESKGERYRLNYSMRKAGDAIRFQARIVETATSQVLAEPILMLRGNQPASAEISQDNNRWQVLITRDAADGGRITLTAWVDGAEVQRTGYAFHIPATEVAPVQYQGAPISLNLKDADLRDVLRTFADLTGMTITAAPDVQGTVNVDFVDVPWDQALDQILTENGYTFRLDGSEMHVFRPGSASK